MGLRQRIKGDQTAGVLTTLCDLGDFDDGLEAPYMPPRRQPPRYQGFQPGNGQLAA